MKKEYIWDVVMNLDYSPKRGRELGYVDPYLSKNQWRFFYYEVREKDPYFIDPPVKNSVVAPRPGTDTRKDSNLLHGYRYMGMPMDEWRYKVLYRQNPTIQNIYEKWDISDEHPGMAYRSHIKGIFAPLHQQGSMVFNNFIIRIFPAKAYFSAPPGEECLSKTWSFMRMTAAFMVPVWGFDIAYRTLKKTWKERFLRYPVVAALPICSAFLWSSISCLMCNYRKKDDLWNYLWACLAASTCFGLRFGVIYGFRAFVPMASLNYLWRVGIDASPEVNRTQHQFNNNFVDALSYKWGLMVDNSPIVAATRPNNW